MSRLMPRNVFYGWYIVAAGAVGTMLVIAVSLTGFTVFIKTFHEELGWSLGAIALGFSIRSLEQGVLSPFTGYVMDRFGPRRMGVAGIMLVTVSLLMFSQVHHLPVYYAASVLLALGQSVGSNGSYSLAITRWFDKKRGRAMGWLGSLATLSWFAPLVMAAVIGAFGWREALLVMAALVFVIGMPLALVVRDHPGELGYLPDGAKETAEPPDDAAITSSEDGQAKVSGSRPIRAMSGMEVREAVRTPALYMLALANAVFTLTHTPWQIFQIPHYQNVGFTLHQAGILVAIYGVVHLPIRVFVGWLSDIVGRKNLYMASFLIKGVGYYAFLLIAPDRLWMLPIYYLTFGFGQAATTVCGQTMVADYFGTRRFGAIRGLMSSLQVPAAVGAPLLAGWMFDRYGSYNMLFAILGGVCLIGALWVGLIRRPQWNAVEARRKAVAVATPDVPVG